MEGLLACLRGSAPNLSCAWFMALLARTGQLKNWKAKGFEAIVLAPQNPKAGERGLVLVGRSIAAELKVPLCQPFSKIGKRSQHARTLGDRMDASCFVQIRPDASFLRGKKVLLLDDVLTTGTTLDQCAYLLRKAGVAEVVSFSLAKQMMPSFEGKKREAGDESEEVHPLLLHLFV